MWQGTRYQISQKEEIIREYSYQLQQLQDELKKIHSQSAKTYLFVTHDIREAFKLGTKIIIMNKGKIIQYGTPDEIKRNPKDDFVIELLKTTGDNSFIMTGEGEGI